MLTVHVSQITAHHQTWTFLRHPRNQWPRFMAPCFHVPEVFFLVTPGGARPHLPLPFREDCFLHPFLFQSNMFPLKGFIILECLLDDKTVPFRVSYKKKKREFPGGPVVRTLRFHCWGPGSIPGQRITIPRAAQCGQKKKKERLSFLRSQVLERADRDRNLDS